MSATRDQIDFIKDFISKKCQQPSLKLDDMLSHPQLQECNKKLWHAYHTFQALYPGIDAATNAASENRLCQFDLI